MVAKAQHNQAEIIKKISTFILASIRCEHVHRLELQKSFTFWVAVAT